MAKGQWLSFAEAVALVRDRLGCSIGKAQAVTRQADESDELRATRPRPKPIEDDGFVDLNDLRPRSLSRDDLVDWLNRNSPAQVRATQPRPQPDRERAKAAAAAIWGTAGPPSHMVNSLICREVADWLKRDGQKSDISNATILRAVDRKE